MAIERKLTVPEGYEFAANPRVASFAAQLDDQLALLRKKVEGLSVEQLEWQLRPGMNTVGMLLAHLAVVDLWWLRIAPTETPEADGDRLMQEVIGILADDDGLPAKPDARHPESLAGKSIEDYLAMLDSARAVVHAELRQWSDADLMGTFTLRDRVITREWAAYHTLEHFAGHFGQILLLQHMMRDERVLE